MAFERQDALPAGSILQSVYRIERVLGAGAFGITYLAQHINLHSPCVIKEYLPEIAVRKPDGYMVVPKGSDDTTMFNESLAGFFAEAKLLHEMNHPNIVKVNNLFESNGTAYFVMPYMGQQTLLDWIAAHPQPSIEELDKIFIPLLEGLKYIHAQNLLHRDIKPANILITANRPVLIDFGSARLAIGYTRPITTILTPGFAPIEQYNLNGHFTPALDLYSLAGCMYQALTGNLPEQAPSRLENDKQPKLSQDAHYLARYPEYWLAAVDKGLNLRASERWQTAFDMQNALLMLPSKAFSSKTQSISRVQQAIPAPITPPRSQTISPRPAASKQKKKQIPNASKVASSNEQRGCLSTLLWVICLCGLLAGVVYYFGKQVLILFGLDKNKTSSIVDNTNKPYLGKLNIVLPSGKSAIYNGWIVNGKANDTSGKASLSIADGTECRGSFRDNHRDGEGVCHYPKGSIYTGGWKNDRKYGYGRYSFPSNGGMGVYEGGFINNKLNGKGKLTYPNGALFEGEFSNNDIKNNTKGSITGMDILGFVKQQSLNIGKVTSVPLCQGIFNRLSADCAYKMGNIIVKYKGLHKNGLWEGKGTLSVIDNGDEGLFYEGNFHQGNMTEEITPVDNNNAPVDNNNADDEVLIEDNNGDASEAE